MEVFPRLRRVQFSITSDATPRYNCIAYAAGDVNRWWEPTADPSKAHWPAGVPRHYTFPSYVAALATLGFKPCADGQLEKGFEKIALFADSSGRPTHAARQLPDGRWTSKLGLQEDITHRSTFALEGGDYGDVVMYLARPNPPIALSL